MDLKTYEEAKFELAELVRFGQRAAAEQEKDDGARRLSEEPWRNLLIRLAEDRFTVVVAGRFNQGKSSLMNAVLGLDRLPTGIIPLTSVITVVRYGTTERVWIDYEGSRLGREVALADLANYVTERGNPGNEKRIRSAEIQLPAEILRRGVFFVDTPGLGSAIFENTRTTESFIPEIDVLVLVTSYESPLTEDEIRFLRQASLYVRAVFIVVNKHDAVALDARKEVLEYVERATRTALDGKASRPFSVSARDGLAAKREGDPDALRESGISDFESELIGFLTREKARLFLAAMSDRVFAAARMLPGSTPEEIATRLETLRRKIEPASDTDGRSPLPTVKGAFDASHSGPCEICQAVMREQYDFLAKYQYELSTRSETQENHAREGGFCPLHTWHYEQVTSPRGVCTAYPALLHRMAERLRSLTDDRTVPGGGEPALLNPHCRVCRVRQLTEDRLVDSILGRVARTGDPEPLARSALCLPHLQSLLHRTGDASIRRSLIVREAALMERVAEDMQRYAIKHDTARRYLASKEENDSYLRALQLLVGHRNVNAFTSTHEIG